MSFTQSLVNEKKIGLVGPPNSGKTTLFNLLCGTNYKTVNYPGSTVEYNSAPLAVTEKKIKLIDYPGIVTLNPSSPDEEVTVNALFNHPEYGTVKDIIVTVDSSQISRHLLLAMQLIDSGFNVLLVLTMGDILFDKGLAIDSEKLSDLTGVTIIKTDGRSGKGRELVNTAIEQFLSVEPGLDKNEKIDYRKFSTDELLDKYKQIGDIVEQVIIPVDNNKSEDNQQNNDKLNIPANFTLMLDKYILHPVGGLVIFTLIMLLTFSSIFWFAAPFMDLSEELFGLLAGIPAMLFGESIITDLLADGVIGGVGSVAVFIPQIAILFFILGILEDSGYLSRGAMLIDKPLSAIGLNGRSFVPMLSGFACAIPAVMAARTIENKRERLLTIFIIPLLSCSARLPVYSLLIAFIIPTGAYLAGGLAMTLIYITSIVVTVVVSAVISKFLQKSSRYKDDSSFILELPAYRLPKLKIILTSTLHNTMGYIKKAGPIILFFSLIIWAAGYFPQNGNIPEGTSQFEQSYLATAGKVIEPVMEPLHLDWRVGVGVISSFAAREIFVSTTALIFKSDEDEGELVTNLESARNSRGEPMFTTATIVGLIFFFMIAMQCISTIAIVKKETNSWAIPVYQVVLYTFLAYMTAFISVNGLKLMGIE